MKKATLILVIASLTILQTIGAQESKNTDTKTFDAVKRMIGGKWKGKVGKLEVVQTYHLNSTGNAVLGEGTVGDPQKPVLRIQSTLGIDGATGRVYYLDQHNGDTVYFGWCSVDEKGVLSMDFKALAGGDGHWVSSSVYVGSTQLDTTLFQVNADGTKAKVHKMTLTRE